MIHLLSNQISNPYFNAITYFVKKIYLWFPFQFRKYKKLNKALVDLVTNYSLVRFIPLSVKKKEMMLNVKNAVDQVGN